MPKKKKTETAEEQSARFRAEVETMIKAGELNPTEAAEALDRVFRASVKQSKVAKLKTLPRG